MRKGGLKPDFILYGIILMKLEIRLLELLSCTVVRLLVFSYYLLVHYILEIIFLSWILRRFYISLVEKFIRLLFRENIMLM